MLRKQKQSLLSQRIHSVFLACSQEKGLFLNQNSLVHFQFHSFSSSVYACFSERRKDH